MQSYNTHMKQKIARSPPPPMSHLRDAPVTTPPLSFAEFGQINLKFKKMQSVPMVISKYNFKIIYRKSNKS